LRRRRARGYHPPMRGYELFRVRGVAVRMHPTFLGLALVVLLFATAGARSLGEALPNLLVPVLLFLTVIWHELGHVLAARRLGIPVVDVVLTPLGGMARLYSLHDRPREELLIALAGPAANLLVAGPILAGLVLARPDEPVFAHLRLFPADAASALEWLEVFFSFHFALGTLNLAPIFPMDGGRILRAGLATRIGVYEATRVACRIGFLAALLFVVQPFLMPRHALWVLPLVGLFLFWTGLLERLTVERDRLFGSSRIWVGGFRVPGTRPRDGGAPADAGPVIEARGESRRLDG